MAKVVTPCVFRSSLAEEIVRSASAGCTISSAAVMGRRVTLGSRRLIPDGRR